MIFLFHNSILPDSFALLTLQFLAVTKPANPEGEEGFCLVATLGNQMLVMTSPMLKPLSETEAGNRMLTSLLNEARSKLKASLTKK